MSNAKVVIVGAGAAGIACATRLLAAGFSKVLVLEAEDHIGGRVHSIPFGRAKVDLGAQWCHGEDDNIVYQMVKDLNLLETSRCTPHIFKSKPACIPSDVNTTATIRSSSNFASRCFVDQFYDLHFAHKPPTHQPSPFPKLHNPVKNVNNHEPK